MGIFKKKLILSLVIFLFTFLFYVISNPFPSDQYKHHVFLADAFLNRRLDIQNFPLYYHDIVKLNGKVYIPFPPVPAVILMPLVAIFGTAFKQPYLAMLIASLNASLIYLFFKKKNIWQRLVLVFFYSFGTTVWYATVIGTTWFYALICGNFFLFLSFISFLQKKGIF